MDIGVSTFPTDYSIDITVLAKRVEELGFESLWVTEHPILPVEISSPWPGSSDGIIPKLYADIVDPFIALSRASAVTSELRLGTGICLVPERNPLLLAKAVSTLDHYSGGRFLFGIGAGWVREESEILGGDFEHRWAQTRDSVLAMKELWTTVESEFHGEYYDFPPVYSYPKPVHKPHPPIYLGGMARNVFRRIIAWGDGWIPNRVTPDDVKKGRAILNEMAVKAHRNPSKIDISVFGQAADPNLLDAFRAAGADRVTLRIDTASEADTLRQLEEYASAVL